MDQEDEKSLFDRVNAPRKRCNFFVIGLVLVVLCTVTMLALVQ